MINLIWAMTKKYVIGKNNKLPWNIKAEMLHFRKLTKNKTILMGSKTFLSIGSPLPKRKNIVLTKKKEFYQEKYQNYKNLIFTDDLITILKKYSSSNNKKYELFIIGGSKIYLQTYKNADRLYLSIIKKEYEGDVYFPIKNYQDNFKLIKKENYEEFETFIYEKENN
jgi:dihydrofolate reductase